MSIPVSIDPLGTLGAGGWPRELTDGLLDGWLRRKPEHTAKNLAVVPPTTSEGPTANKYSYSEVPTWTPKTLLFCSMASFRTAHRFNPPQFTKTKTDSVQWGVTFYGISNLSAGDPLDITNGIIIDTPARAYSYSWRVAAPFDAIVTNNGDTNWRLYDADHGWQTVRILGASYTCGNGWAYCDAWAVYDSVLSDSEAVHRLELLRQFTTA